MGGAVFKNTVCGVPSEEFHLFVHHHKDNSAYLLNHRC